MDFEAIFTTTYYVMVVVLFVFSLVRFIKNLKKPWEERRVGPTIFFVIMTIILAITIIFVMFIAKLAGAYSAVNR